MTKDRFIVGLLLEALDDPVPGPVRVRRALKALLRSYNLRCRLFLSEAALVADEQLVETDHTATPWRLGVRPAKPRKTA